ncbi:hypothetical protein KSD_26360 [Ktedonobacter sp. SOSP1-85]|nr:hypothetical protein KSD_26360 [Ktedonobacter sp. SOSP1-85]
MDDERGYHGKGLIKGDADIAHATHAAMVVIDNAPAEQIAQENHEITAFFKTQ